MTCPGALEADPAFADRRPLREREFSRASAAPRLGRPIVWLGRCGSTNDLCKARAAAGDPEGLIVAADEQTAGRGRKGDPWLSPPGAGLWASFLLRPRVEASLAPRLTVVLAASLVDVLRERLGIAAKIKEPNDVLVEGRKVAGILAESTSRGGSLQLDFLVMGIGVNLTTPFPPELRESATRLEDHLPAGEVPAAPLLLAWLLETFESRYDGFCAG